MVTPGKATPMPSSRDRASAAMAFLSGVDGASVRGEGETAHPDTTAIPARITTNGPPPIDPNLTVAIPLRTSVRERGRGRA